MYESDDQRKIQNHINLMNGIKGIVADEYRAEMRLLELQKRHSLKGIWNLLLGKKEEIWKPAVTKIESNYFSKERIAVYTCIIGNYDTLREPLFIPDNCDFFVITNQKISEDSSWTKIDLAEYLENYLEEEDRCNPILVSRLFKILPFEFFKNYRFSIYIDANFQIYTDLTEFIYRLNSKYGMAFFMHEDRCCVYDEIRQCIKLGKDTRETLESCVKYMNDNDMPEHYGLLAGGIIVRNHENERMMSVMWDWWEEYKKLCRRDQISLPYVLYVNNILPSDIGTLGRSYKEEFAFRRQTHKKVEF